MAGSDRAAGLTLALAFASLLPGCADRWFPSSVAEHPADSPPVEFTPRRGDYEAFRSRVQGEFPAADEERILEPNYLPFMAHRLKRSQDEADLLVFCRWPNEKMPLAVFVPVPEIPDALQDEFRPIEPEDYVASVVRALETWEKNLESLVRFEVVDNEAQADLVVRIHGARAPSPEKGFRGLGRTAALNDACSRFGSSPALEPGSTQMPERERVHFAVPEVDLYLADEVGLLEALQLEGVALHEIGHVLGMKHHSPVPVDLMYAVPTDRIYGSAGDPVVEELTDEDVNSFVSLYRIPNGTVYTRVAEQDAAARGSSGRPPDGEPMLGLAPHVDARDGFEVRVPRGWVRVPSAYGLYAANGPIWDHDASLEIFFWPHPTVEGYLERYGEALFRGSRLLDEKPGSIDGRASLEIVVESPHEAVVKDFRFVELEDDRVVIILCEAPTDSAAEWRPWFQAALDSLEIWDDGGRSPRGRP